MRRRHIIVFVLIVLLALTTIFEVSAWSARRKHKHIPGFHVVKRLTKNMVAGSTYTWKLSFVNPKSENGLMNVTLEIVEEHGIGFGEFTVKGILESYDNPPREHHSSTLTVMETEGGCFQNQTSINERFNIITLTISSVPNLMPGTYMFTLTVTLQY